MLKSKTLELNPALRVLQRLLVITRQLAQTGAEPEKLAQILDEADYLVTILIHEENGADEFKDFLKQIGRKFPEFAGIEDYYDELDRMEAQLPAGRQSDDTADLISSAPSVASG